MSVWLRTCLSVCVVMHLSVCLYVSVVTHLSVCLSVCVVMHLSVCLSVCLCGYAPVCLSVCLSVWLRTCLAAAALALVAAGLTDFGVTRIDFIFSSTSRSVARGAPPFSSAVARSARSAWTGVVPARAASMMSLSAVSHAFFSCRTTRYQDTSLLSQ